VVKTPDIDTVWQWLDQVPDPEIPVISLVDLGIGRDVAYQGERLRITLSPTYSGCPATRVIEEDVRTAMRGHGIDQVIINQQISPPWTTDWMSDKGKAKLQEYGIVVSQFGSTPCKAHWRCEECRESFDYFKCI